MKKTALFISIALAIATLLFFTWKGKISKEQFNSERWKNWEESEMEMSLRWDMMNSLRNTQQLKGKTKLEIIELLGEPESKDKEGFRYYLGYSKRGINTGSLSIKFNKKGIVSDYSVWDG